MSSQDRICVEKILPHQQHEYNSLKEKSNSHEHHQRLRAAFITKKLWPKGATVYIAFIETGNQIPRTPLSTIQGIRNNDGKAIKIDPMQETIDSMSVQDGVRKIVRERIQPIVGLKLIFTDNIAKANIRVGFDPDGGAWSLIGTDCLQSKDKSTLNLGWFDVATTMHEFGHAMGMIHEHQNPDGNKIKWNDAKVYQWAEATQGWDRQTTETNIINRYAIDQINGSKFDPMSIMLYFFSDNLTINNQGTHQNLRLSGYDVEYLNKMYPDSPDNPNSFYEKVYGQSLQSSIDESNKEKSEGKISKNVWIGLAILVGVVLLGVILWLVLRKRNKGGRYR